MNWISPPRSLEVRLKNMTFCFIEGEICWVTAEKCSIVYSFFSQGMGDGGVWVREHKDQPGQINSMFKIWLKFDEFEGIKDR